MSMQQPLDPDTNYLEQARQTEVLLIYPYFYTHAPQAMLFHPLGIAQLAAVLRGYGLRTRVIDCTFEHRDGVIAKITRARPRIVEIYVMLSMSENAMGGIRKGLYENSNLQYDSPGGADDLCVCGGDVRLPVRSGS